MNYGISGSTVGRVKGTFQKYMLVCGWAHTCMYAFQFPVTHAYSFLLLLTNWPSPGPSQARESQLRSEGAGCSWAVWDQSLNG